MFARALLIVLLVCLTVGAAFSQENLLVNGDFEDTGPGPGPAPGWIPYEMPPSPPADYEVTAMFFYSGAQSQMWSCLSPFEGGIYQQVMDLDADTVYEASVYFCDPIMMGTSVFQIGIEPDGGPPDSPGVIWSAPMTAGPAWQQATIEASPTASDATVVLRSNGMGTDNHVAADKVQFIPKYKKIANVPDFCQLAADGTNSNYCGPVAATNITEYWDVVMGNGSAVNVNAGLGKAACHHIAYFMDTNNAGCPYRNNGCGIPQFPAANGTYVADIAPGVAQFAAWDAAHTYGCTPPPNVPAGKIAYPWTVQTLSNNGGNLNALYGTLVGEIAAGRPLLVTWSYWNLDDTNHVHDATNDIDFYEWGAPAGGSDDDDHNEEWNEEYDPTVGPSQIGHIVTAVGYWTNYDPDGGGGLPQDNWVICHDTWCDTPTNVALPMHRNVAQGTTAWAANTTIVLQAPAVAALTEGAGNNTPKDHWGSLNNSNVMIQLRLTETSGNEAAQINAVELTAMGSGDDKNDIGNVSLYDDVNGDGKVDGGDTFLAASNGGYPSDNGTLTIMIPGPPYNVAKHTTRIMLVVYWMNGNGSHGSTYKFITPKLWVTGGDSYQPISPNVLLFLTKQKKLSTISLSAVPCPPIHEWKGCVDGTWIVVDDCTPIISCEGGIYGDTLYLQEDDRTAGIMVDFGDETAPSIPVGYALELSGYIDTVNGERVMVQPEVLGYYAADVPQPVGMCNQSVGGGDFEYNPATGEGQKGILGAYGLNSIGLLVKTCGLVTETYVGTPPELSWFRITDGSPETVKVLVPPGVTPCPAGQFVSVAGICSCEESGDDLLRLIKVRTSDDIQVESP